LDPVVQQEVAGRRGDVAVQRQTSRQGLVEQLSAVHPYGWGDNEPQFVDHPRLEQRLGQSNAPGHPDIATRLALQLADELRKIAVDDRSVRPGPYWCGRRRHELLDAIDEAGERLAIAGRPERRPF